MSRAAAKTNERRSRPRAAALLTDDAPAHIQAVRVDPLSWYVVRLLRRVVPGLVAVSMLLFPSLSGADTAATCTTGTLTSYCQDIGAGTVNAGAVGYGFAFGILCVLIIAAWTVGWSVFRFMARS